MVVQLIFWYVVVIVFAALVTAIPMECNDLTIFEKVACSIFWPLTLVFAVLIGLRDLTDRI